VAFDYCNDSREHTVAMIGGSPPVFRLDLGAAVAAGAAEQFILLHLFLVSATEI